MLKNPHPFHLSGTAMDVQLVQFFGVGLVDGERHPSWSEQQQASQAGRQDDKKKNKDDGIATTPTNAKHTCHDTSILMSFRAKGNDKKASAVLTSRA